MATRTGRLGAVESGIMAFVSVAMIVAAARAWVPLSMTEVLGFVTGGICVWLVVREHTWTWPIGIANNVFFFVLFLESRLYADMALQVVYVALGAYGWWAWLHGGRNRTPLAVGRATRLEWWVLAISGPVAFVAMREVLVRVHDAAPAADALTTVFSLIAQYLMCRKLIENWWFWILADVVYIPLYTSRSLPLTAALYGVFLVMCFAGLRAWHRAWKADGPAGGGA